MWGELQAFKVGRVVKNRTLICKGLTVTWFFSNPNLKACNSPYMQYYFKRFFVLHSLEVIFSFLIKTSRQKAIEIGTAFFIPLGIPRVPHWIISFMLHISAIISPTNWYLCQWVSGNISEVINENSLSAFNYLDDFRLIWLKIDAMNSNTTQWLLQTTL